MIQQQSFGSINFAKAQFGDARRTKRLVALADQIVMRPGGSLPQKFRSPADLQAFYRLMDCEFVTHESILQPHREATISQIQAMDETVLIIHDATELDYTKHYSLKDLGSIGSGQRSGYIVQNSLAVRAQSGEPLGLLNQVLHRRADVSEHETRTERFHRTDRESRLWSRSIQSIPQLANCVDVCDRGADTFEFMQFEIQQRRRFVIRSAHNRRILSGHKDDTLRPSNLHTHMRSLPASGTWQMEVTSKSEKRSVKRKGKKQTIHRVKRTANMAISFAPVQLLPSRIAGAKFVEPLKIWCVRVWEVDPPAGQERLEWFLQTSDVVDCFETAFAVTSWYERRWIIEEYHKGLKTGSRLESLQFTSEARLQPAIALLSITTLTLLQLRDASRQPDAKTRPASELVSPLLIAVLSLWRHKTIRKDWTVHEFYMALARLGGHQNRKGDHTPGWQVLWEGWKELLPMSIGYQAACEMRDSKM